MRTPILVTGSHRSGTTWIGSLLAASNDTHYIHEPLNPDLRPSWTASTPRFWYESLAPASPIWRELEDVARLRYPLLASVREASDLRGVAAATRLYAHALRARAANKRAIIKDPFMLFNAESFSERFGAPVIVMVRQPAAFVSSLIRRNWAFDFRNLLSQHSLLEGDLSHWANEIDAAARTPPPLLDQGVLLWRVLNDYIRIISQRSPQLKILIYEEVVSDVEGQLRRIYSDLGLAWASEVRRHISELTTGERRKRSAVDVTGDSQLAAREWESGLTPGQVDYIADRTSVEAKFFYPNG